MIIVNDVDLCVVPSDIYWWEDLNKGYACIMALPLGRTNYDLSVYFNILDEQQRYAFWSKPDLYDDMEPSPESSEVLSQLSKDGHTILFASYCKKGHFGSKYDWLKKHFPFMNGFFATKEKEYIKADVFIDDRNDMLNNRFKENPECTLIKFDTPYTQDEELKAPHYLVYNWEDIGKILTSTIHI